MEFKDLGLSEGILKAVEEIGYKEPTPIQAQAIPAIQMCRDVLGLAQTGTGKTAAFTIPMIDALAGGRAKARMPRSLILSPTRELAAQISENFVKYGKYHSQLSMALIVGGTSMDEQVRNLERGVDVLIATPGRLLDLFERGKILLADIKILVIDEADRMMDMGFIPDLEKIVSLLPPMRQTLFFSATMPGPIKKLADKYLSNPKTITVSPPSSTSANVEQYLVNVTHPRAKTATFIKLYEQEDVKNAFVFCNRKRDIDEVCRFIKSRHITCAALHGDMEQDERTAALNKFKAAEVQVLVCSDVAARGLDIQGMSHVFNWDVPFNSEDYVHRIGRTGRAGAKGRAFTMVLPSDEKALGNIHKLIGKKIDVLETAGATPTEAPVPAPSVQQKARHHNRDQKQNHRHRRAPEDLDDQVDVNNGSFGNDIPSFLQKK
ncbi:MAG TPA: DEAD/DEAH box helicase [Alphaproteobacteria bacterium]|nr:DEAD/DEAH box helicase [Rhodospirillaceae bacterium]HRJ67000.1 DEAD/DEAH box helicase [Alphaproteobacteria bacterium]